MAKKDGSVKIRLVHKESGDFYTTTYNAKNAQAKGTDTSGSTKLRLRKYNKKTRKHEEYVQEKIG